MSYGIQSLQETRSRRFDASSQAGNRLDGVSMTPGELGAKAAFSSALPRNQIPQIPKVFHVHRRTLGVTLTWQLDPSALPGQGPQRSRWPWSSYPTLNAPLILLMSQIGP